jgi:hypothetical protein
MSESRKRILEMLSEKKISVDEAERLLAAIGAEGGNDAETIQASPVKKQAPKYLRVVVDTMPENGNVGDKVNVKVPMNLIRAGMKLTSLIPPQATDKMNEAMRDKGIDFDMRNLKPEDLEEIVDALSDLEVNVDGKDTVRVYVE